MFFDEAFTWRSVVYEHCFGHIDGLLDDTNRLPPDEFIDFEEQEPPHQPLQQRMPQSDIGLDDLDDGEVEVDVVNDGDTDDVVFQRRLPPVDEGEKEVDPDPAKIFVDELDMKRKAVQFVPQDSGPTEALAPQDPDPTKVFDLSGLDKFDKRKKYSPKVINRERLLLMLKQGHEFTIQQENPKLHLRKDGTPFKSWSLYEGFKHATNWKDFQQAGGDIGRFEWDFARGFIHFKDAIIQSQFDVAFARFYPREAAFRSGYYGDPIEGLPDSDCRSPFYLCGFTKFKILPTSYQAWWAKTPEQREAAIALVDDPRFHVSADLKELEEIEDTKERQQTYDAIVKEIRQLIELGTFEWAWLPDNTRPLSCKLVLKVKYHADGSYDKHKARLTVRGCFQVPGRDFEETFAPTAGQTTSRILDAVAVLRGWKLFQGDIANAFCQSLVDVPVYIELPRGIDVFDPIAAELDRQKATRKRALRLVKALYGLRQSPRLFYKDLAKTLQDAGFTRSEYEPCLFWRKDSMGKKLYSLCYVDDLKVTGDSSDSFDRLQKALALRYGLPPFEPLTSFTGVAYNRVSAGELQLNMRPKLESCFSQLKPEHVAELKKSKSSKINSPCDTQSAQQKAELTKGDLTPLELELLDNYSSVVGSIGWPAKVCYPHYCQSYSMLSRTVANPTPGDARALRRILQYIIHHMDEGLTMKRPADFNPNSKLSLMGFTDSNYGDQKDIEYRATGGYCFFLSGILISYRAKREDTTSTSTFEAEMQAAYMGIEEGLWLKHVLEEVEILEVGQVPLFCDNNTLVLNMNRLPEDCNRTHICTKYFKSSALCRDGKTFNCLHIPGEINPADIFTKSLPVPTFKRYRDLLLGSTLRDDLKEFLNQTLGVNGYLSRSY